MGVALENARLFDETRRLLAETEQRAAELGLINSVQQGLAAQLDMQAIFDLVGDKIRQIFDAQVVLIGTFNIAKRTSRAHYAYEKGQRFEPAFDLPLSKLSERLIQTRQPVLINREADQQAVEIGAEIVDGTENPKSMLFVPMVVGDQVKGVISLQNIDLEEAFSEADVRLLMTLANSMSVALENARLFDETQRLLAETEQRASEMAALAEIGSDIASTHELKPVLERLVVRTKELLKVSDIALFMVEPGGETLCAEVALGKYADEIKATSLQIGEGIIGSDARLGRAEIIQHPSQDPRTIHIPGTPEEDDEVEGLMCAPLISRNKVIGMIGVWRQLADGQFTQAELEFLVSLARQAAIAIESARLYMETERRASQMATIAEVGTRAFPLLST